MGSEAFYLSVGRLLVVGAINVDFVVAAEHLPRPGETVVGRCVQTSGGGKGGNAAVAAARNGAAVRMVGAVGADSAGADARRELVEEGIDCSALARIEGEPTGVALIVVDSSGENQIAVGAGANMAVTPEWVATRIAAAAPDVDCVLVSTEIPGDAALAAVSIAASEGLLCILNPAPLIPQVVDALKYRPIVTPNRGELTALIRILAGRDPDREPASTAADVGHQAEELAAITQAPVIVTLGVDGILIVEDSHAVHVPAPAVTAVDATGAGDTFNGVLAAQIASGAAFFDAARFAMGVASLSVAQRGARSTFR